jgi:phage terminase small subunit
MPKLRENEFTDKQDQFIHNLVRLGNNPTQSARLAGYADPKQSSFNLVNSPKVLARIRLERHKIYQSDLAPLAVQTLKDVMRDTEAPASARVASARTCLELAGDLGKHSQSNARSDKNLADMSVEELASIIDKLDNEKIKLAKDVTPDTQDKDIDQIKF